VCTRVHQLVAPKLCSTVHMSYITIHDQEGHAPRNALPTSQAEASDVVQVVHTAPAACDQEKMHAQLPSAQALPAGRLGSGNLWHIAIRAACHNAGCYGQQWHTRYSNNIISRRSYAPSCGRCAHGGGRAQTMDQKWGRDEAHSIPPPKAAVCAGPRMAEGGDVRPA
jgi:hypothetical protein